jgi:flagellar biosynthetic protein FlhB
VIKAVSSQELLPTMPVILDRSFKVCVLVSLPVLGAALVTSLIGNYFQVGFLFTTEPLTPKFDKLNPVQGVKQMFSQKRLVEVLKQLIKFILVGIVVYMSVKDSLREIVLMPRIGIEGSLIIAGQVIADVCIKVGIAFMIIAVADYFLQKRIFKKSMMMTRDEVKREYKESEGDPEQKGERKRLAHEMIMQGSPQKVRNADAVVTNPAHIAVAIQYDDKHHDAPMIVSKGIGLNAEKIKEIAKQHHVPILRNIPLAQALNKLNIDEEIPEELYEAVAEVLNFVYELRGNRKT